MTRQVDNGGTNTRISAESSGTGDRRNSPNGGGVMARWAGVGLTVLFAVLALTVQWGVVTTRLDQIGSQLIDLTTEIRSLRSDLYAMESRVSYLEGRLNGRSHGTTAGTATVRGDEQ